MLRLYKLESFKMSSDQSQCNCPFTELVTTFYGMSVYLCLYLHANHRPVRTHDIRVRGCQAKRTTGGPWLQAFTQEQRVTMETMGHGKVVFRSRGNLHGTCSEV